MLYESREPIIKLFNDYSLTMSEVKYKTKHGEGPQLLSPKQMLRILPIALLQVKFKANFLFFVSNKIYY